MKKCLLTFLFFCAIQGSAQQDTLPLRIERDNQLPDFKQRKWLVGGLTAAGYGGSFVFLSTAWYKDYPRRSFHTFNDAREWQQVDKIGHAWTTYHSSRINTSLWRWAGVNDRKAILFGSGTGLLYMLSIEYLDGHSAEWGWSWADVGANVMGTALFAGQEFAWKEQKISFKFSSHQKNYHQSDLKERADKLYGSSLPERLLKDYNAQTYWLSANVHSFFPKTTMPSWLNIAVGYGAEGMFGGFANIAVNKTDGSVTFDRTDLKRVRQWYLAPDVDLTRIKTKSKVLRTLFSALNVLKFPSPALEFSNGRFRLKALAF